MGIARVVVVAIARNQIRPSCGTVRPCPLRSASSSTNEFVLIGGGWRRSRSSRVRAPLPKFTMLIYSWFLLNGTVDCYLCDGGGVSREVMGPVSVVGRWNGLHGWWQNWKHSILVLIFFFFFFFFLSDATSGRSNGAARHADCCGDGGRRREYRFEFVFFRCLLRAL